MIESTGCVGVICTHHTISYKGLEQRGFWHLPGVLEWSPEDTKAGLWTSDMGRVYIRNSNSSIARYQVIRLKWANDLNRQFSKRHTDGQQVYKNRPIRAMQIETTARKHLNPAAVAVAQQGTAECWPDVKKQALRTLLV